MIAAFVLGFFANIFLASEVFRMTPGYYSMAGVWALFYLVFGWVLVWAILAIAHMIIQGLRKQSYSAHSVPMLAYLGAMAGYYATFLVIDSII